ncbi:hypothetical protein HanRHA438_Chr16g0780141 [Helianthus annuus]|nr:hypothetical protein HanRHA438_Chr16g0780141 [Helianthus annuus]
MAAGGCRLRPTIRNPCHPKVRCSSIFSRINEPSQQKMVRNKSRVNSLLAGNTHVPNHNASRMDAQDISTYTAFIHQLNEQPPFTTNTFKTLLKDTIHFSCIIIINMEYV